MITTFVDKSYAVAVIAQAIRIPIRDILKGTVKKEEGK